MSLPVLDWTNLLALLNVVLGLGIILINLMLIRRSRVARLLRHLIVMIALYWTGLYLFVFLAEPGVIDPVMFGQVFVRPAFSVTLAIILACGIYRWKSPS